VKSTSADALVAPDDARVCAVAEVMGIRLGSDRHHGVADDAISAEPLGRIEADIRLAHQVRNRRLGKNHGPDDELLVADQRRDPDAVDVGDGLPNKCVLAPPAPPAYAIRGLHIDTGTGMRSR
jgi:hypothetical protein